MQDAIYVEVLSQEDTILIMARHFGKVEMYCFEAPSNTQVFFIMRFFFPKVEVGTLGLKRT